TVQAGGICLTSDVVTHTQIVMNSLPGHAGRVTATCPPGTRLLGGGGRQTPGNVGNLKLGAIYPTFNDDAPLHRARAAHQGELNPDSWSAAGLINGSPDNATYTTYAYAICTDGADISKLTVKVHNVEISGTNTGTTGNRMPITCQPSEGKLVSGGAAMGGTD